VSWHLRIEKLEDQRLSTGGHEVRGSIPLGSTKKRSTILGPPLKVVLLILCIFSGLEE
jgi:hypothetical protein